MIQTRGRDRGQSTVELALILPLVAGVLVLVVQVALVAVDQVRTVHAAREGARAAAVAADADLVSTAQRAAERSSSLDTSAMALSVTSIDQDRRVRVVVRYRSRTDLPLIGVLVPDIDLTGTVEMMRESLSEHRQQQ